MMAEIDCAKDDGPDSEPIIDDQQPEADHGLEAKGNKTESACCELVRAELEHATDKLKALEAKLEVVNNELEREVQRRCDLEQRFTEEAKRSTDQIEELIAKSDQDDAKLQELKKKFELYSHETSSMIENFTTNREVLTSQLLDPRQENDYLFGKYMGKSRDLQN